MDSLFLKKVIMQRHSVTFPLVHMEKRPLQSQVYCMRQKFHESENLEASKGKEKEQYFIF